MISICCLKNKSAGSVLKILLIPVLISILFLTGCSSKEDSVNPKPTIIPAESMDQKYASVTSDAEPGNNDDAANSDKDDDKQTYDSNNRKDNHNMKDESFPETESENESQKSVTVDDASPLIIVLDPGHGGIFSGAVSGNITEKDITLKTAFYVRDFLLENYSGIDVFLTRESDIELDSDIVTELEKRAIFAKEKKADYFVSLHFNASDSHNSDGATIYASVSKNVSEKSRKLGANILNHLCSLGLKDNGVQTRNSSDHFAADGSPLDYYAVLRHNAARDIPAVIVEHCFMDNAGDITFMDSDEKLKKLAEADAMGIADFLGLKQKDANE